jgi:phosphoglucosamine mutase
LSGRGSSPPGSDIPFGSLLPTMGKLFGTDGVRGKAGSELTADLAWGLGSAAVSVLGRHGTSHPVVVVGRDTRASGEWLEDALVEGIRTAGGDVILAGVDTTPAIAFMTVDLGASAGVVISASHNPPEDNGIKFFSRDGTKLPDPLEDEIEAALGVGPEPAPQAGRVRPVGEERERYVEHLVGCKLARLDGMSIVVDCANGSASYVAPRVYRKLGATVHAINASPDGMNINVGCGALHPEVVAAEVVRLNADAGVTHDGDADRALFADASGNVVDGDQVLAACAAAMHRDGQLDGDTVVATVMANIGFTLAMRAAGIDVITTKVGDRYVAEEMRRTGAMLGGEQSGHVIFRGLATTGDGILTAIRFLSLASHRGVSLKELASSMRRYPQVIVNAPAGEIADVAALPDVARAVKEAESALGEQGRVLVRPSGTEPVIRVMVEADSESEARTHAESIAAVIAAAG